MINKEMWEAIPIPVLICNAMSGCKSEIKRWKEYKSFFHDFLGGFYLKVTLIKI